MLYLIWGGGILSYLCSLAGGILSEGDFVQGGFCPFPVHGTHIDWDTFWFASSASCLTIKTGHQQSERGPGGKLRKTSKRIKQTDNLSNLYISRWDGGNEMHSVHNNAMQWSVAPDARTVHEYRVQSTARAGEWMLRAHNDWASHTIWRVYSTRQSNERRIHRCVRRAHAHCR